jgi:hypothetical protein
MGPRRSVRQLAHAAALAGLPGLCKHIPSPSLSPRCHRAGTKAQGPHGSAAALKRRQLVLRKGASQGRKQRHTDEGSARTQWLD